MSDTVYSILELLSVELWRDIFDYFSANDLWYSFRGLNRRINRIIDQTTLHVNFKKQNDYHDFITRILPSINVVNIRSLRFEEVKNIRHFFSKRSLNSFVQLRCLLLDYVCSSNDHLGIFWRQISSLKHLQFLQIIIRDRDERNNRIEDKEFVIRSIFNQKFCSSLKSLIIRFPGRHAKRSIILPFIPTTTITNIKHLWIDPLTFGDLITLLPALQNVRWLRMGDAYFSDDESDQQQHELTMTKPLLLKCIDLHLKLLGDKTFEHVEYLLKHTPNLRKLFLWTWYDLLDARRWEMLLSEYCSKADGIGIRLY